MLQYIVFSLPRSRSFWLSNFLTVRGKICGHDEMVNCGSIAEAVEVFNDLRGSCETGAVLGWKLIRKLWPELKIVVVFRPLGEVVESLGKKMTITKEIEEDLYLKSLMLMNVAKLPGVMVTTFEALRDQGICKDVFEFCNEDTFSPIRWRLMEGVNIQVDFDERIGRLGRNYKALTQLKSELSVAMADISPPYQPWLQ